MRKGLMVLMLAVSVFVAYVVADGEWTDTQYDPEGNIISVGGGPLGGGTKIIHENVPCQYWDKAYVPGPNGTTVTEWFLQNGWKTTCEMGGTSNCSETPCLGGI